MIARLPVDLERFVQAQVQSGRFASFDEAIAEATLDVATKAVEELTGKPAEDVRSYLARHRAALLAPAEA